MHYAFPFLSACGFVYNVIDAISNPSDGGLCVCDSCHYSALLLQLQPASKTCVAQGVNRLGSLGNRDVFRTLPSPQNNITTRSSPTPQPPWGGHPYLNASMYDWMVSTGIPCTLARSVIVDCALVASAHDNCGPHARSCVCTPVSSSCSWMRCAPLIISSPRINTSNELEYRGSSGHGIV